jgi:hypothetical protein
MGISVGTWIGDVVDSKGVTLRADGSDVIAAWIYEDKTYPLLSGIDPYGNTIFNNPQLPRLIEELERRLNTIDIDPEVLDPGPHRRSIGKVLELARECLDAHDRPYLVFLGD